VDYSALNSQALVLACLDTGDDLAWEEFVRRFQKLVATVVFRTSQRWGESSPQIVDELVQETYLKLCAEDCRLLRSFRSIHDDAIYGYVKVLTANLVHDHFKGSRAEKRGGSKATASLETELSVRDCGQPEASTAVLERKILVQQVATCLDAVTAGPNAIRDRRIFWLYYRAGLTASAIAGLPGIGLSTKGVESTLLRITRIVRQQLTCEKEVERSAGKTVEGIRPAESL
jgi:RNA polymerase sigma factor (sigma-70 family)